ncbi:MAG: hypothetical protein P0120_17160 [Nitrospira sp.]|nr:hypothetical protein [Nitrospira sp.]
MTSREEIRYNDQLQDVAKGHRNLQTGEFSSYPFMGSTPHRLSDVGEFALQTLTHPHSKRIRKGADTPNCFLNRGKRFVLKNDEVRVGTKSRKLEPAVKCRKKVILYSTDDCVDTPLIDQDERYGLSCLFIGKVGQGSLVRRLGGFVTNRHE